MVTTGSMPIFAGATSAIECLASEFGYEYLDKDQTYRRSVTLRPNGQTKKKEDEMYVEVTLFAEMDCNNILKWDLVFTDIKTDKVVRRGTKKADFKSKTVFAGPWVAYQMPGALAGAIKLWLDIRIAELKFAFR